MNTPHAEGRPSNRGQAAGGLRPGGRNEPPPERVAESGPAGGKAWIDSRWPVREGPVTEPVGPWRAPPTRRDERDKPRRLQAHCVETLLRRQGVRDGAEAHQQNLAGSRACWVLAFRGGGRARARARARESGAEQKTLVVAHVDGALWVRHYASDHGL